MIRVYSVVKRIKVLKCICLIIVFEISVMVMMVNMV